MTPAAQIAEALRPHDTTLRALGLRSLALFGSGARASLGPESDLDLLYEFDADAATLDGLLGLQAALEEILGRDVDLVSRKYLSPILSRHLGDVVPVYEAGSPS
ncbi:nucleotidyltransferase family protein [Rubrivirga sp.]|uniref:nucleotidyltransferase family protein n=1 Tax=Rubrivirga sp. TaxID=1885344 RepID=UPI003B51F81A